MKDCGVAFGSSNSSKLESTASVKSMIGQPKLITVQNVRTIKLQNMSVKGFFFGPRC